MSADIEERILTERRKQPQPPTPGNLLAERPDWRSVQLDKLAKKLWAAHGGHDKSYADANWPMVALCDGDKWMRAAEAAVDDLIDGPMREYQPVEHVHVAIDGIEWGSA